MFLKIRLKIGNYFLNKQIKKHSRNAAFKNFKSSRKIGLIHNITNKDSIRLVRDYKKSIISRDIEVVTINFIDYKNISENIAEANISNSFTKKDLNWYYKPNKEFVQKFINTPFDILIDLSVEEHFPMQYIVALSKAQFKVGSVKETNNYYDFMIDIGTQKELKNLIKQIDNYLEMIK